MKKYCKFCKEKTEFRESGYKKHNFRLNCGRCGGVFIPFLTRMFGQYKNYPKWVLRKDWENW